MTVFATKTPVHERSPAVGHDHVVADISLAGWGRKEIAYPVGRHKFGHFVCFNFSVDRDEEGTHSLVDNLVGILRITDAVIKYQVHKIHERVRKFRAELAARQFEKAQPRGIDGRQRDFRVAQG